MSGPRIARKAGVAPLSSTETRGSTTDASTAPREGLLAEIERLVTANSALRHQIGRTEANTLLPNRRAFLDDFAVAATNGRAIILVTLADARHYNELLRALGHSYAEDFVRAGSARLAGLLAPGTTIYHVSVLSFAFWVDADASATPPAIVPAIVAAFREPIVCQAIPVNARTGVGFVAIDELAVLPGELLRSALAAAQDSRASFDGWARYNRKRDEAHLRAFRLLTDLPAALAADGQLHLNYQPRIALNGGKCVSAEALIRWRHPGLGAVSPGEFVPLAETTALITSLTHWVVRHALQTVRRWQAFKPGLKISINVSPKNLEEPDFIDFLCFETETLDVDPNLVELEFTEGALTADSQLMLERLRRLTDSGFHIAIDDFGSGYSNMSYLAKLPARILKIDQFFIRSLESEAKIQLLVRAIIELAHSLDYSVVAEGIETEASLRCLEAWRCDEGQGFFLSRPLPEASLAEWLVASR